MKAFENPSLFRTATLCAGLLILPSLALAGPDDPVSTRQRSSTRPAPPEVTVRQTTTVTDRKDEEEIPIQPLRQREESTHYRIAFKLLNDIGFTGMEGDRRAVGYQQIYGPPPMLVYQRPPRRAHAGSRTSPPRRTNPPIDPPPATEDKPDHAPDASKPGASPAPTGPTDTAQPSPDGPEPGILPDPTQGAGQSRNNEILSYFQRPNATNRAAGNAAAGNGEAGNDPSFLQGPEQPAIPPSRATYRVVPK